MTRMHNPPHPGEVLREYLGEVTVTEAAVKLGVNRVTLKDGRVMEARQGYFKGGADHPLSDADLQTKFFANCLHGGVAKPRAEAMLAMIQQIFDAPQVDLSLLGV